MADISHELRTPLSVLKGELEAIEDGVRKTTPATLASLQAEVGTLSKLVNDLYELVIGRREQLQGFANLHFTVEGSKVMGEQVSAKILEALKQCEGITKAEP